MTTRIEHDSMGQVIVPKEALYGAQTQRSINNFNIGQELMPKSLIYAYALIKQVAAQVNSELGLLKKDLAEIIIKVCQEIIDGKLDKEFPLKIWQTGSGTQTNMNINEVIANRSNQILGCDLGIYSPIHPNDHVNLGQSTNDSFPTAMHIAAALEINHRLLPSMNNLIKTLDEKTNKFAFIIKMGRTHMQDATPITLGQEFSAYAYQTKEAKKYILNALPSIYELALGGTAVGTGINTHPDFAQKTALLIAQKTGLPFITSPNKFAALASNDPCANLSGALNNLSISLMKIANDIRLLSSGPRGGLYEISMAENEPGSSIMPGKVNPTQCEAITMIAAQVMGNNTAITIACSQGHLELNVFKPVIIKNLLHSIDILSDGIQSFNEHCLISIAPNIARLKELESRSLMLITALTPHIGYEQAAKIAKLAHQQNKTLKEICLELNIINEELFDEAVRPETMLSPQRIK
jgi:fumarate hydratase class II